MRSGRWWAPALTPGPRSGGGPWWNPPWPGWHRRPRPCARAGRDALRRRAVLGALLRHAGEPLAARAVLQAVVPALRTLAARRVGGSRHLTRQPWEADDDFDADVVEVALRRIAALAGTSPTWPAQAICESTWMTVRAALVRSSRWGTPASLEDEVANVVAGPARSDAEALALAVVDAVRAQRLAVDDARVIYATRVLGHTPAELASAQGRKVRALRAQRVRAERRLVDAGWAPRTRGSCRLGGPGAATAG